jgi:hypothetical protein
VQHRGRWAQLAALVRDGADYSRARLGGEVHRPVVADRTGLQVTAIKTGASGGGAGWAVSSNSPKTKRKSKQSAKNGEKEMGGRDRTGGNDAGPLLGAETAPAPGASDSKKETSAGGGGMWVHMPA